MAFSFKNVDENQPESAPEGGEQSQGPQRPQPILHKPKGANPLMGKMGIIIGGAVVLLVVGFFVFRWVKNKKAAAPPTVVENVVPQKQDTTTQAPPPATMTQTQTQAPPQMVTSTPPEKNMTKKSDKQPSIAKKEKVEPPPKKEPVVKETPPPPRQVASGSGEFTIFVGSFKSKLSADDLSSRWHDAGYDAFVSEKGILYRVCLGKYSLKAEAQSQADKLKDAFEDGYWIGKF